MASPLPVRMSTCRGAAAKRTSTLPASAVTRTVGERTAEAVMLPLPTLTRSGPKVPLTCTAPLPPSMTTAPASPATVSLPLPDRTTTETPGGTATRNREPQ